MTEVVWFRRDLRVCDHGALAGAAAEGEVLPLFVVDPAIWSRVGPVRRHRLAASLRSLDATIRDRGGDGLVVRTGDPREVVSRTAIEVGASRVWITQDFSPLGVSRDVMVRQALRVAGAELLEADTPYLHAPGSVLTATGGGYNVFTPYYRAWSARPIPPVIEDVRPQFTRGVAGEPIPAVADVLGQGFGPVAGAGAGGAGAGPGDGSEHRLAHLGDPAPAAVEAATSGAADGKTANSVPAHRRSGERSIPGERAALSALTEFVEGPMAQYAHMRDRPDLGGTSRLSAALHFGEIHPRTALAAASAAGSAGAAFVRQLCWRDFYADVLHRKPGAVSANIDRRYDMIPWATGPEADRLFVKWIEGRTGFPFVDAGMRQLAATGWLHNRLRMVVASFLTKDLLIDWRRGANWFMQRLEDADVANNSLGWQWTAGTGTDAAPYFRVFNPVLQGLKFDPDGQYVRRFVPELRHIPGIAVHEPWRVSDGYARGYPKPLVVHSESRAEVLRIVEMIKAANPAGQGGGSPKRA